MEPSPNIALDQVENRFLFVLLSAKRALQLQKGARPRTDVGVKKPTVVAMSEVLLNKVQYELPGGKEKAEKPSKKERASRK